LIHYLAGLFVDNLRDGAPQGTVLNEGELVVLPSMPEAFTAFTA